MRLLWKEWQQQKWIIFGGLLAGISFPVLEYFYVRKDNGDFQIDTGSAALLIGGAFFAIILAIATMHHDIRKGVDFFWQSKPIKAWKLFAVKLMLAAFLMYIVFLAVISLDLITHSRGSRQMLSFAWASLCYTYPVALLLFALSMFIMVVTRDAAKTAFLAIWVALLIYFLPLMFRGLEWMNFFEQLNSAEHQPSVIKYLIWICSLPGKIDPGMVTHRPAGIPVSIYQTSVLGGLLRVMCSPVYLRYLLFVGVFTMGSIICVFFSVKALKHNWRWCLGQKSIVWAMGLSAAAIFGFAMFQVGHNLEPTKELNGKELINPVPYGWNYMPASLHDDLPEGHWIGSDPYYYSGSDAMCIKDNLMFRFTTGYQSDKGVEQWSADLIRHFVLQVYQFPYAEDNRADSDKAPHFVVGAMRFFQTEPVKGNRTQKILGCFTRGDRLYAAYRPRHISGGRTENDFPGSLNPMYFITFDISDPALPKVISNMEISNSNHFGSGMADIGNYCYINDGSQLMILSVENADKPEIVHKITFEDDFLNRPTELGPGLKSMVWFPSWHLLIQEDKLICWDRHRITLFDISDKLNPQVVYDESFNDKYYIHRSGIQGLAFRDDTLYLGTQDGLSVLALEASEDGSYTSRLIGRRRTTPIEELAGRNPGELLLSENYLIEQAGIFGAIVYDISNPSKPRRTYHAQVDNFASDIGFWNGLLFMQGYYYKMSFYELPGNTSAMTGVKQ